MTMAGSAQPGDGSDAGDGHAPAADLEAILDVLSARVTIWDRDLTLRYANRAAARLAGTDREQMPGLHLSEALSPEDLRRYTPIVDRVLAGTPQRFSGAVTLADGTESTFETCFAPTHSQGTLTGFAVVTLDTTPTMRASAATLRNEVDAAVLEQRLTLALDLERDVIAELQVAMKNLARAAVVPQRSSALRREAAKRITHAVSVLRHRVMALDYPVATTPPVEVSTRPVRLAETTRREPTPATQTNLTREELREALDAAPCMVSTYSPDFVCTFANSAAREWHGREVVGLHATAILGEHAFRTSVDFDKQALGGQPQRFVRTVMRGGRRTHTRIDYVAQSAGGRTVGVVAVALDVTDRIEAEEILAASAHRVGLLHDRTRISQDMHDLVIQHLYGAGLLVSVRDGHAPDRIASAMENLETAVSELRRSVLNLEDTAATFDFEDSAARVLSQSAQLLGFVPSVQWTGSTKQIGLDPGLDALAVLTEALSNAARHARLDTIEVSLHVDERIMRVSVRDDGQGNGGPERISGLRNIALRAERHGGLLELTPEPHGTLVTWEIPLPRHPSDP